MTLSHAESRLSSCRSKVAHQTHRRTLHSNLEGNYATIERHERTIMEHSGSRKAWSTGNLLRNVLQAGSPRCS